MTLGSTRDSPGGVVLVGASGLLGLTLRSLLAGLPHVATYLQHPFEGGCRFDARRDSIATILDATRFTPTAAILMHGISGIDACAADPDLAFDVNVTATKRLVDACISRGIVPVFVSSDAVFDGDRGGWSERDEANPIHDYGRHKRAVERYLEGIDGRWLAVRLPKLLSLTPHPSCMVSQWVAALRRGAPIVCANDQRFSPIAAADAARVMLNLVRSDAGGIFHIPGPEAISRAELLGKTVGALREYQPVSSDIRYCSLEDIHPGVARPKDTSMVSDRLPDTEPSRLLSMNAVCRRLVHPDSEP